MQGGINPPIVLHGHETSVDMIPIVGHPGGHRLIEIPSRLSIPEPAGDGGFGGSPIHA